MLLLFVFAFEGKNKQKKHKPQDKALGHKQLYEDLLKAPTGAFNGLITHLFPGKHAGKYAEICWKFTLLELANVQNKH
jgi:hypothetical protein